MARANNLRRTAASQAQAEYGPQKKRLRRETGSQVRSIRSTVPALTEGLQLASQQLGTAGLSPRDLAIARAELANRIADVSSGAVLQEQTVRQDARGQLVDLNESQGQAQRSILAQLQQAQAERQQEIQDARNEAASDLAQSILKEETFKRLGLGSYSDDAEGGGEVSSRRNANVYAKQLIEASAQGVKDPDTDEWVIPPGGPVKWSDQLWQGLTEKVADADGVDNYADAARAVERLKGEYVPSTFDALKQVAATAAPLVTPSALQPIAQFGANLLRR